MVPVFLVSFPRAKTTAISFPLYATGIGYAVFRRPCIDPEPIGIVSYTAAMELKLSQKINETLVRFDAVERNCLYSLTE